jgi:dihydroxyacid dehydratase/phosphogluconate dehydratase
MYNKSTKFIKSAKLGVSGDANIQHIVILDCVGDAKFTENIKIGIACGGGISSVFSVPNFDYFAKTDPATARYADSFAAVAANMTRSIIKTNLADCVVAAVDCEVAAYGILLGCIKANCPVLFAPVGVSNFDSGIFSLAGRVSARMIKAEEAEEFVNNYPPQNGYPADSVTAAFFSFGERLGLSIPDAHNLPCNSPASLAKAKEIGAKAVNIAATITTPKKLLSNKKVITEIIASAAADGINVCGIIKYKKIFELTEIKFPHNFLISNGDKNTVLVRGSAANDGGYIQITPNTPLSFEGKAWVYEGLESADSALQSNAVDTGVMVIQSCAGEDISIIAHTITALGKQRDIAVATDGYCEITPVLTVTNVSPNGYTNEEFANIQNGDIIEIDAARGRFNTSVSAKDMKIRAKRKIVRQQEVYFN